MLEDQRSKSPEEGGYIIEGILWLKHLHETTLKEKNKHLPKTSKWTILNTSIMLSHQAGRRTGAMQEGLQ